MEPNGMLRITKINEHKMWIYCKQKLPDHGRQSEIPIRLRFIFGISNDYRTLFISNICLVFFCVGPFRSVFFFLLLSTCGIVNQTKGELSLHNWCAKRFSIHTQRTSINELKKKNKVGVFFKSEPFSAAIQIVYIL